MTWCDVDTDKDVVNRFEITKVPFLLLMHPSKQQAEFIKIPSIKNLAKVLGAYEEFYREAFVNERTEAFREIEDKLSSFPIVMFIRGSPIKPQCKSSKVLVDQFEKLEVKYRSYDIMLDQKLKEWLKFYSNWPSYP